MESNNDPINEANNLHAAWVDAIGRFFVAFGEFEWFTYLLVLELPTERIFESVAKMPLNPRIKLIKQLLDQKSLDKEFCNTIRRLLDEGQSYIELRNTIAHNPLRVGIYENHEGDIDVQHEIAKFDNTNKPLRLEEMTNACNRIEEIMSECLFIQSQLGSALNEKST